MVINNWRAQLTSWTVIKYDSIQSSALSPDGCQTRKPSITMEQITMLELVNRTCASTNQFPKSPVMTVVA